MKTLLDLAAGWRKDADLLRDHGATEAATTTEKHAEEVVAAVERADNEHLTLAQGSVESHYAVRTLRQKVASGEIPNAGKKNAPRIRRGDLPTRVGSRKAEPFDASTEAQSILGGPT